MRTKMASETVAEKKTPQLKSKEPKQKKTRKSEANGSEKKVSNVKCAECGITEASPEDLKLNKGWIGCKTCKAWFHDSCAEVNGVLDDKYFYCKGCVQ